MRPIERQGIHKRIAILAVLFLACFVVIFYRAFHLQVISGDRLARKAAQEYEKTLTNRGRRGVIYDGKGREIAVSIKSVSIGAYPHEIERPLETASSLSETLALDPSGLKERLASRKSFVWVKRQVTPSEERAVREMRINGMGFIPEHSRYYPNSFLAAQVIGFTGVDGHGLEGIEYFYDTYLKGAERKLVVLKDALGKNFEAESAHDVLEYSGNNIVLTIDLTIQYIVERALAEAVGEFSAKSGMAVVMEPSTGAVLALANVPRFNPNVFYRFGREVWRNRVITDPFEPGSTMKIFTAAAAIETGGCTPNTIFFCENGEYRIGEDTVHDTHPHGWLPLHKVVKYSSNIGAIKISEMIGPESMYERLKAFGFGERTGIDCPGETAGLLTHFDRWSAIDTGAIAFGHGMSASAIQLITAVSAIANKGVRMKPYLVKAINRPDGSHIREFSPSVINRAISEKSAELIKRMMVGVVEEGGTGYGAVPAGYSACGKTGTSKKLDETGEYATRKYLASFVGFAPVESPQIAVLVVIDEPATGYYGGKVAAPAFRKIVRDTLNYLNVPSRPSSENLTAGVLLSSET